MTWEFALIFWYVRLLPWHLQVLKRSGGAKTFSVGFILQKILNVALGWASKICKILVLKRMCFIFGMSLLPRSTKSSWFINCLCRPSLPFEISKLLIGHCSSNFQIAPHQSEKYDGRTPSTFGDLQLSHVVSGVPHFDFYSFPMRLKSLTEYIRRCVDPVCKVRQSIRWHRVPHSQHGDQDHTAICCLGVQGCGIS